MPFLMNRLLVALVGVATLCALAAPLAAQGDADSRVAELLNEVERLKNRVTELEEDSENAPGSALEERVNALSESLYTSSAASNEFSAYWKTGLRLDVADKTFRLKIGGRIMNDFVFGTQDDDLEEAIGRFEDGTEFRRARIYIAGQIHEHVIFKSEYNFTGGDVAFNDVYLGLRKIGFIDKLRVGHFFQPQGLEELTSSKYITFIERSLPGILAPQRETGIGINGTALENDRMTWFVSVFRDVNGVGDSDPTEDGKYNFGARVTALVIDDADSNTLLHVGVGFIYRNPNGDSFRIRQRPEIHLSDRFVDTGNFSADEGFVVNFELSLVLGPLALQGEFYYADYCGENSGDPDPEFWGFYVYASYFLTGEHRAYSKADGAFKRIKTNSNFLENDGIGAWEIAARFSYLDLNSDGIEGGELTNFTFGVNWYLNPNTRVMLNYVYADVDDLSAGGEGEAHIVAFRFMIDF